MASFLLHKDYGVVIFYVTMTYHSCITYLRHQWSFRIICIILLLYHYCWKRERERERLVSGDLRIAHWEPRITHREKPYLVRPWIQAKATSSMLHPSRNSTAVGLYFSVTATELWRPTVARTPCHRPHRSNSMRGQEPVDCIDNYSACMPPKCHVRLMETAWQYPNQQLGWGFSASSRQQRQWHPWILRY